MACEPVACFYEVLLECHYTHLLLSTGAHTLQWQRWVLMTKTTRPTTLSLYQLILDYKYFVKKDFVISHFSIKYLNKDNQRRYLEFKYLDILKL